MKGLFTRGTRYYLQFRTGGKSVRHPLRIEGRPVRNLEEAKAAMLTFQANRQNEIFPQAAPKLSLREAIADYVRHHRTLAEKDEARRKASVQEGAESPLLDAPKKLSTVRKEELILARWAQHIGEIRLGDVKKHHITDYLDSVLEDGKTRRTRNVHLSIFRNLLTHFADKGILTERALPTVDVKLLKHKTPKREFLTFAQVQALVSKALEKGEDGRFVVGLNGQELADLIRLLAYSGTREMEALRLRWADVDFTGRKLHIGRDGQTKNRESRSLEFNPDLEALLQDMHARRAGDSPWVFPSPKRGDKEEHSHWTNPHKVWYACRSAAGLPKAHLHDLRHHFASQCIMAGIDFMTIARWLGHQDGGILVGKTYGHLADEHKREMASKLVFTPRIIQAEPQPTAAA